jgi:hypothetical protein
MTERWLPVPGYEDFYEVSDQGRVRSLPHQTASGIRGGHVLTPWHDKDGYLRVAINVHGAKRQCPVHQLVLLAFAGPMPVGQESRHGTGGKLDNRIVNLCYGTPLDNTMDQIRDGTKPRGTNHGKAKLTESLAREIRCRYASGETQDALAAEFGVSQTCVSVLIRRKTWRHV